MSSKFLGFQRSRENNSLKTSNSKLKEVVDSYTFLEISEKNESELNLKITQNFEQSKVIIINHYEEHEEGKDDLYFIVSFKRTIVIINKIRIKILQMFLLKKEKLKICFLNNTKDIFDDNNDKFKETTIKYKEIKNDEYLIDGIKEINSNFFNKQLQNFQSNDILSIIKSSISGYLIIQSYYTENRLDKINNSIKPREIKKDEIIELKIIGTGSIFYSILCYYIEYEKLVVVKKCHSFNTENEKLLKREIRNYKEISHPFIPEFYGTIQYKDLSYPVIEFIKGKTLEKTDLSHFTKTEIFEIILQMLLVIHYLHYKHFIYRDLKTDNVIIDENKIFVLIDFDRMVKKDYIYDKNNETADFTSYSAPEINSSELSDKCDIYSIGKMIDFVMNKSKLVIVNDEIVQLFQMYILCINDIPELRPTSSELIKHFLVFIIVHNIINVNKSIHYFSLASNQNIPEAQHQLGLIYYEDQYISRDINKSIHYFTLAANQNFPKAQFNLGLIYEEGKYISQDINKAIYYFSLASNQNHPEAHLKLGVIYYSDQYISRDINKAIYYFSFAADQNHPEAQYILGLIYEEGQYISRDINKSIYYYSLAANQNHPEAQCKLGLIYKKGKYVSRDINKSIYYFSLAANQNIVKAHFNLGSIYYSDQYVSRDINKAIYHFSLAANQNHLDAQYNLGVIFEEGQYVSRDINKSIHYYSLAANQNDPGAQFNLGLIYYSGQYVSRDINKSIYYYSLASNQNHLGAQFNLGLIYYLGHYVSRDINKAIFYFSLAANQSHPGALCNLGLIYFLGQYIPRDIKKAINFLSLAANQNDLEAQFNLGLIYYLGQYTSRDINKAVNYLSLAGNRNHPKAQYILGLIYEGGQYIPRDIKKAIHYYSLASNQSITEAQFNLGLIYCEGKYISRDINKAIHYYKLAANQNRQEAQCNLGLIYYEGKYISQDINKSIYYYSLAANQNDPQAQYNLGLIYYEGKYISRDINKALKYLSFASNQNHQKAQYILGVIYLLDIDIKQNKKRGIYLIMQSSNNECIEANFSLGFLYQEGKYMKRNIEESIKYYKKASSFNNKYAKNNLGIIYKNYFEKKYDYTVYFEEAIQQKNDPISMYNLSHTYLYEFKDEKLINKSIEMLIKSVKLGFKPSTELLCIIILKLIFNEQANENKPTIIEIIKQKLSKFITEKNELMYSIINIIQKQRLYDQSVFKYYYKKYKEVEFVYDLLFKPVCIKDLYNEIKVENYKEKYNITADFYKGFGYDIYNIQK